MVHRRGIIDIEQKKAAYPQYKSSGTPVDKIACVNQRNIATQRIRQLKEAY